MSARLSQGRPEMNLNFPFYLTQILIKGYLFQLYVPPVGKGRSFIDAPRQLCFS